MPKLPTLKKCRVPFRLGKGSKQRKLLNANIHNSENHYCRNYTGLLVPEFELFLSDVATKKKGQKEPSTVKECKRCINTQKDR